MKKLFCILFVCLVISACDSSSPQSIQKRQINQINEEQKREDEEASKFVERNPDVVPRYEDSNRLLTSEEQREAHDRVVSAINREAREQAVNNHTAGGDYSGIYTNNDSKYSIQFPDGWKVEKLNDKVGSIVASSKELESMYTVSRLGKYSDAQDISLARAQALGEESLKNWLTKCPEARLRSANVIRNLNGREAIILTYQLNPKFNRIEIIVPTKEYTYHLDFMGQQSVLKATSSTVQSFKILL